MKDFLNRRSGGIVVKNLPTNTRETRGAVSSPGLGRSPEEEMATHSIYLAGESHGQRNLVGHRLQGCKESDTTEQLSMHSTTSFTNRVD